MEDKLLNIEHYSTLNTYIEVKTKKNRYSQIYFVIHTGKRNKNGKWKNQRIAVSYADISPLETLMRKSFFFAPTVTKIDSDDNKQSGSLVGVVNAV